MIEFQEYSPNLIIFPILKSKHIIKIILNSYLSNQAGLFSKKILYNNFFHNYTSCNF